MKCFSRGLLDLPTGFSLKAMNTEAFKEFYNEIPSATFVLSLPIPARSDTCLGSHLQSTRPLSKRPAGPYVKANCVRSSRQTNSKSSTHSLLRSPSTMFDYPALPYITSKLSGREGLGMILISKFSAPAFDPLGSKAVSHFKTKHLSFPSMIFVSPFVSPSSFFLSLCRT